MSHRRQDYTKNEDHRSGGNWKKIIFPRSLERKRLGLRRRIAKHLARKRSLYVSCRRAVVSIGGYVESQEKKELCRKGKEKPVDAQVAKKV